MSRLTSSSLVLATALLLSACVTAPTTKSSLQDVGADALTDNPCDGASSPRCLFINAPVRLGSEPFSVPTRRTTFFKTQATVQFVDNQRRTWLAPTSTLTDGASIPQIFVPIIGNPRSKEFLSAATLHDAYCGIGNENNPSYHARRWQDVHRMFYDTLIVGGTQDTTAKIMFAAVYLAGPRWSEPRRDVSHVPVPQKQAAMRQAIQFIEAEDPDLNELQIYLKWLEKIKYRGIAKSIGIRDDRSTGSPGTGTGTGNGELGGTTNPSIPIIAPSTPTIPTTPTAPATPTTDPSAGVTASSI